VLAGIIPGGTLLRLEAGTAIALDPIGMGILQKPIPNAKTPNRANRRRMDDRPGQ
jgi:hypothetical protein